MEPLSIGWIAAVVSILGGVIAIGAIAWQAGTHYMEIWFDARTQRGRNAGNGDKPARCTGFGTADRDTLHAIRNEQKRVNDRYERTETMLEKAATTLYELAQSQKNHAETTENWRNRVERDVDVIRDNTRETLVRLQQVRGG